MVRAPANVRLQEARLGAPVIAPCSRSRRSLARSPELQLQLPPQTVTPGTNQTQAARRTIGIAKVGRLQKKSTVQKSGVSVHRLSANNQRRIARRPGCCSSDGSPADACSACSPPVPLSPATCNAPCNLASKHPQSPAPPIHSQTPP